MGGIVGLGSNPSNQSIFSTPTGRVANASQLSLQTPTAGDIYAGGTGLNPGKFSQDLQLQEAIGSLTNANLALRDININGTGTQGVLEPVNQMLEALKDVSFNQTVAVSAQGREASLTLDKTQIGIANSLLSGITPLTA